MGFSTFFLDLINQIMTALFGNLLASILTTLGLG